MNAGRPLYDWFLDSVLRWPDAVALDVDGAELTYAELARLADRAAVRIAAACGTAEQQALPRLGLCADRGLGMYVGYLAIQRLGATAVPLSPRSPAGRNFAIAESARVGLVLADPAGVAALAGPAAPPVLPLAELLADRPAADGPEPPAPPPTVADQPAYILFTSGSTGVPKGVPVGHANVAAFLEHIIPAYRLVPGCRVSQTFELTFDPSVLDLFASWGAGATVVVMRKKELLIPAEYVRQRGLTHWFSVPSIISLARGFGALPENSMPGLRCSVFMGEPLTIDQAANWHAAAPGSVIENAFGPTELTVLCTGYRLPSDPVDWPRTRNDTVPIGTVFPHLEAVTLDEHGRPAAEGELCVRGSQRFSGYLDDADNDGRFLTYDGSPAVAVPGDRRPAAADWYRTGDRVRVEDGVLVHVGRLDRQLKLRGQRVELGEVEAVLRRCEEVVDAVVVALPDYGGQLELHAAVAGTPAGARNLEAVVRAQLPDYMRPRSYTWIPEVPLNANGKVDRAGVLSAIAISGSGRAGESGGGCR